MADRLSIYNQALGHLGERPLKSLTEEGPSRRALDDAWLPGIRTLHEQAFFNWSIRAIEWEASTDVEPRFGWTYVFQYPEDYIRTVSISSDEYFTRPNERYELDSGYLHSDVSPLYLRYVSSAENYMMNVGAWTQVFADALAAYMAYMSTTRITQNRSERADLFSLYQRNFKIAKSMDAMNEPTRFMPDGTWTLARRGGGIARGRGYQRA